MPRIGHGTRSWGSGARAGLGADLAQPGADPRRHRRPLPRRRRRRICLRRAPLGEHPLVLDPAPGRARRGARHHAPGRSGSTTGAQRAGLHPPRRARLHRAGLLLLGGSVEAVSLGPGLPRPRRAGRERLPRLHQQAARRPHGARLPRPLGQPGRRNDQQRPQEQLRHHPHLDPEGRRDTGEIKMGCADRRPRQDGDRAAAEHRDRDRRGEQPVRRRDAAHLRPPLQLGDRERSWSSTGSTSSCRSPSARWARREVERFPTAHREQLARLGDARRGSRNRRPGPCALGYQPRESHHPRQRQLRQLDPGRVETTDTRCWWTPGSAGATWSGGWPRWRSTPPRSTRCCHPRPRRPHPRDGVVARRWGIPLYLTERRRRACAPSSTARRTGPRTRRGEAVQIGASGGALPHRARRGGPLRRHGHRAATGEKLGIATDLGRPTATVRHALRGATCWSWSPTTTRSCSGRAPTPGRSRRGSRAATATSPTGPPPSWPASCSTRAGRVVLAHLSEQRERPGPRHRRGRRCAGAAAFSRQRPGRPAGGADGADLPDAVAAPARPPQLALF
jgi:hypothetical protein